MMRDNLIQYVHLLFAGVAGCEEVRDEILQNTLDRYDDLIDQGKSPEAAYQLSISGIGDIQEILGSASVPDPTPEPEQALTPEDRKKSAISIGMYILCPIPLLILSEFGLETLGLCLTLLLVAAATVLRMTIHRSEPQPVVIAAPDPGRKLRESINRIIWVVGIITYVLLSFATSAWEITWLIFPLMGAVEGLAGAIIDYREG